MNKEEKQVPDNTGSRTHSNQGSGEHPYPKAPALPPDSPALQAAPLPLIPGAPVMQEPALSPGAEPTIPTPDEPEVEEFPDGSGSHESLDIPQKLSERQPEAPALEPQIVLPVAEDSQQLHNKMPLPSVGTQKTGQSGLGEMPIAQSPAADTKQARKPALANQNQEAQALPDEDEATTVTAKPKKAWVQGTKHDLLLGSYFLAGLIVLSLVLTWGLCAWKKHVDILPTHIYSDLVWSRKTAQLAYLQNDVRNKQTNSSNKLWIVDSFGEAPKLLAEKIPLEYSIVGWLEEDRSILLQSAPNDKANTVLLKIDVENKQINKYNFPYTNMRVVGCGPKYVFVEQPYSDPKTKQEGINLLGWSVETAELSNITTVPFNEHEHLRIEEALPSPDDSFLALTMIAQVDPSIDIEKTVNPEALRGVWMLNRKTSELTWTTISVESSRSLRVAWCPDGTWLVAVAWLGESSRIYRLNNKQEIDSFSLLGASAREALRPIVQSSLPEILLVSKERVLKYNFLLSKADVVLDGHKLRKYIGDMSVAPEETVTAFTSTLRNSEELFVSPLYTPSPHHVKVSTFAEKNSVPYIIASNIESAFRYWWGSPKQQMRSLPIPAKRATRIPNASAAPANNDLPPIDNEVQVQPTASPSPLFNSQGRQPEQINDSSAAGDIEP